MYNKLFSLLILVVVFGFIGGLIYYLFFSNAGDLEINVGDISGVEIQLNSQYNASLPSFVCNKTCNLSNVPPVNYDLIATKEGYEDIIKNIKINKGKTLKIKLDLKKEVYLNEVNGDNKDKIGMIKYKKLLEQKEDNLVESGSNEGGRKILGFKDGLLYYYKYNPDFSIYSFDSNIEKKLFTLKDKKPGNVIFNKNDLLVIIKTDNTSVFDIKAGTNYNVNINENILYVKKTIIANKVIVTTDLGVYLYDLKNNSGIKNTLFNDFIVIGDGKVLGLISKNDKPKMSLLNFTDNGKDKIVLHIINTRDKNIIYETDKNVSYIESVNNNIILTDKEGIKFEVKELKY